MNPTSSLSNDCFNGKPSSDAERDWLADGRDCLEAALRYEAMGWSVLCLCPPDHVGVTRGNRDHVKKCDNHGKVPWHLWKELQERRQTAADLRGLWAKVPASNVGVATGPVSGMVGIDADGPEGEAELEKASGGDLPPTLEFSTGKGRRLLYALPAGVDLRTTHRDHEQGRPLSFLAKGSQTVMPPSRHRSGRRYEWTEGRSPDDVEAAPAPAWLLDALRPEEVRKGRASGPAAGNAAAVSDVIPEGARDSTLARFAGTMRRKGADEEEIYAALTVMNGRRCDPPLPDEQVRKIARSIAGYTAADPIRPTATRQSPPPSEPRLGALTVRPGRPARTGGSGKLTLPLEAFDGAECVYVGRVTEVDSSRRGPARTLASLAKVEPDEADRLLVRLLAAAADVSRKGEAAAGPTMHSILAQRVRAEMVLTHRTAKGLWSESFGREVTIADVCRPTTALLEACVAAADWPKDNRTAQVAALRTELEIVYGDLLCELPDQRDADSNEQTEAADLFRASLIDLWTRPRLMQREQDFPVSASLVSRVKSAANRGRGAMEGWQQVHSGYSAWWRRVAHSDGSEDVTTLAMRFELATQVGVTLPDCKSATGLTRIGKRYGCFASDEEREGYAPPLSDKLTGGGRLNVLSAEMVSRLLETPEEEVPEESGEDVSPHPERREEKKTYTRTRVILPSELQTRTHA